MKKAIRRIDPMASLAGHLLEVEKPARYLGGEVGSIVKTGDSLLSIALCFPDLYEIGMSNNAIRILYSGLNAKPSVRAERVFAPAPDFESLLDREGLPLYTLESGIALCDVDILGFSLGYELAATSILAVLRSGRIPLRSIARGEGDPIVIAGGPAAANPHPLAMFLDAAFIGEAEGVFFDLAEELALLKGEGASRSDLLERLASEDAVWLPSAPGRKGKRARRGVFRGFGAGPALGSFPIPSLKTVQDHGTVEIMRGCPNGCRFCQAGYFYRPQRSKAYSAIREEVESLVKQEGYREITLASLSSGDYRNIGGLLDALNAEWGQRRVSFQLPSLKINGFTLPIVRKLSEVRKSGLTFAVETPVDEWQKAINKDVCFEQTVAILEEALAAGFKQAKFYFMLGLPVPGHGLGEARAIVDFFERLGSRSRLQINVNVGTFVPKPHTPFQWSAQLRESEALEAINFLRSELRRFRNIKVSYHSPFISQLEGVIARGDERLGPLILEAFEKGARLDAWEERFDRGLWRSVLEGADWAVVDEICGQREEDAAFPWDDIAIRVSKAFLRQEYEKSIRLETTSACLEDCTFPCGACGESVGIENNKDELEVFAHVLPKSELIPSKPKGRLLFKYTKTGSASFLPHLSIVDAFERAMLMAGLPVYFSEGFNPKPRLETSQPISIAIESICEVASILVTDLVSPIAFTSAFEGRLPEGIRVLEAEYYSLVDGKKQRTIGSLEWGSAYLIQAATPSTTKELEDALRTHQANASGGIAIEYLNEDQSIHLGLRLPKTKEQGLLKILEAACPMRPIQAALKIRRIELWASISDTPISFFEAYRLLA